MDKMDGSPAIVNPEHPYAHLPAEERLDQLERRFRTLAQEVEWVRRNQVEYRERVERLQDSLTALLESQEHVLQHQALVKQIITKLNEALPAIADGLESADERLLAVEAVMSLQSLRDGEGRLLPSTRGCQCSECRDGHA